MSEQVTPLSCPISPYLVLTLCIYPHRRIPRHGTSLYKLTTRSQSDNLASNYLKRMLNAGTGIPRPATLAPTDLLREWMLPRAEEPAVVKAEKGAVRAAR